MKKIYNISGAEVSQIMQDWSAGSSISTVTELSVYT